MMDVRALSTVTGLNGHDQSDLGLLLIPLPMDPRAPFQLRPGPPSLCCVVGRME